MTSKSKAPSTISFYLLIFVLFFIINLITSGGHLDLWDGMVTFMITESMALKHTAQLHPEIPRISEAKPSDAVHTMMNYEIGNYKVLTGKYYEWVSHLSPYEPVFSSRSLLLPGVAVPFYLIADILSLDPLTMIGLLVNSLIISLTALVVFCFSYDLYGSKKISLMLGAIFVGCSFILPYNNTLFPQPLQSLCLITAAYFLYKSRHINNLFICNFLQQRIRNIKTGTVYSGLAAVFLGMSIFASPTSALFVPAYIICSILYFRNSKKLLFCFLVCLAILVALVGLVNYLRFGTYTEFGYGWTYGRLSYNQGWTGLIGLLASPGKGLIVYFPAVILLPVALKFVYRQEKGLFLLTTYVVVVSWLYFGTLEANNESRFWSGAIAWGPRYLIPVLPFLTIALGALIKLPTRKKWLSPMRGALIAFSATGFIINLPGILVWSEYGTMYAWEKENLGGSALETMTWNPKYSPVILHFKALSEGYVSNIPVEDYRYSSWYYAAYGLAPCEYDLFIFCELGLIPVAALGGIGVTLAVVSFRDRRNLAYVYS